MSERIAGVSLTTILLLITLLTAARGALYASRVAAFRAVGDLLESVILAVVLVFLLLRPFVVQSFFIPSGSMHPTLWEGDHILVNKWVYRLHPPVRGDIVVFRAPREAAPDEKEYIKRVVGVPGDTVAVEAGYITVDRTTYTRNEIRACLGEQLSVDQADSAQLPPLRLTRDAVWLGDRRFTPDEFARRANRHGAPVHIEPGRVLRNGQMLMECYVAEDAQYDMRPRQVPPGCLFVMGDNRNQSQDSHVWGTLRAERVIGRADLVFWPVSHLRRLETP
jgi:signal peptidase I